MKRYYLTFGSRYKHEEHPVLGYFPDLADGYITIEAEDYTQAREKVFEVIGQSWAFLYNIKPDSYFFPLGEIGRISENEIKLLNSRIL